MATNGSAVEAMAEATRVAMAAPCVFDNQPWHWRLVGTRSSCISVSTQDVPSIPRRTLAEVIDTPVRRRS